MLRSPARRTRTTIGPVNSLFRVEVDGRPASAEEGWELGSAYGHFTAMQVRGGKTRGIALHLDRLEAANREIFGATLDRDRVLELIGRALGDVRSASLRVYCLEADPDPAIVVTVKDPGEVTSPQRLLSVPYQRPDAHLKHLATGQAFYSRLARGQGFDDALLVGSGGEIAEVATANIGFFAGDAVVWPDAPQLRGITMQLLERTLPELGVPSRRAPVRIQDIASFEGAYLSNSRGIASVTRVDDVSVPTQDERITAIADAYASVPWDAI
jgi:branched-subunit amino acid aminotransferase/4-amino-4-deoxychorismate lyase